MPLYARGNKDFRIIFNQLVRTLRASSARWVEDVAWFAGRLGGVRTRAGISWSGDVPDARLWARERNRTHQR